MAQNKRPKWLNTRKLMKEAGTSLQKKADVEKSQPKLKTAQFKQITAYSCPGCRLKFTSGQIESQIRKAAREGQSYVNCPQCGTALKEDRFAQVKDPEPIVHRAYYLNDTNRRPNVGRVPNMWVDKAIYGRLVQKLGEYVTKVGIFNPQMKFQRGIRSSKFPGEPHSAKGAEFSVEFIDQNNTRNRIFIQAGLTAKGEFIFPRTFKTTIGQEYPLTAEAITNMTSGKLFDPIMPDAKIPPLNYRQPDYTRFREISANQKKMQKTAQDFVDVNATPPVPGEDNIDDSKLNMQIQEMGITDPTDQEAIKQIMRKYIDSNAPETFAPNAPTTQPGGNFMQGIGLSTVKNKLNLRKISRIVEAMQNNYSQVVLDAINNGLTYDEAVEEVYTKTGMPLNERVWTAATDYLEQQAEQQPAAIEAALAKQLVAQAEEKIVKKFQKTAEDVKEEFDFSGLSSDEVETFVDTFVTTYNQALIDGNGITNAQRQAHYAAGKQLHENRIKRALRDEQTLVPYTETDPDYSLAEQTKQSEPRFDHEGGAPKKYHEMDGGISDMEDRNYSTMFKGTASEINRRTVHADVKQRGDKWVVTPKDSEKVLGEHDTKEEAIKQLQAIEISKHKGASIKTASPDKGINPAFHDIVINAIKEGATFEETAQKVKSETGMELRREDWKEAQVAQVEKDLPKTASIKKKAAYQVTETGQRAIERLNQGIPVKDFDSQTLLSILTYLNENPYATTDTLQELASMVGMDPNQLRTTFSQALAQGLLTITPEENVMSSAFYDQYNTIEASQDGKIQKEAESTGIDLAPDEVGQNPINYSRYKTMIQDLIRAGNIPPTKVDMHALKDNKYTLQELKDLVQTFKVNDPAVMYPTPHAASREDLVKLAENKLSDILKEMPMQRVEEKKSELPNTSAEGKDNGEDLPPLSKKQIKEMHEEMSEDKPETDTIKGGLGDDIPSAAFDVEQLVRGIEVEYEHTKDKKKAEEIAKDHLLEDPAYYIKLHEMESTIRPRNVDALHKALTEKAFNARVKKAFDEIGLTDSEGQRIAETLGVQYNGIQRKEQFGQDDFVFTDPVTGSSFNSGDLETAANELKITRQRFANVQFAKKLAQQEEEKDLPPGTVLGPGGEIISKPGEPEEPEKLPLRLEPPRFLTRKAPGIDESKIVEAIPEEAQFVEQITASKAQIDDIRSKIATMQKELQTKIAPLQKELGAAGQNQMRATRALAALMKQLNHTLIQVDNQVAEYTEVPVRRKLTAADKIKVLLDKFGEAATQALAEAENNLNQIEQVVVGRYRQWPKKTSAEISTDDQFVAALYQETYNILADFLDVTNELNIALATAA